MTEERLVLAELLEKAGEGDFLRAVAEAVLQLLMESDVEGLIGAGRYERSGERSTWRNGYRDRTLDTRLGSLQLRIPKLRQGSYFPPFLEARKSSEKALIAVIPSPPGRRVRRLPDSAERARRRDWREMCPRGQAGHRRARLPIRQSAVRPVRSPSAGRTEVGAAQRECAVHAR